MNGISSSRAHRMRALLAGETLGVIMEAHDGLSARIVEEAGLPAVWASGLSISAALGMRDANEASVTEVLDVLERMADATDLPILVDGDTGFGNFNNARRFVRKLGQRGLAGVVIEDKLFPKANSFVGPDRQLADADEMAGKLRAMCDARTDRDFVIVARVEALIAERGLAEAKRRAEIYVAAGADAIVIHSKRDTAAEVLAFAAQWEHRAPLIAIPTTYPDIDRAAMSAAGFRAIIIANHNLRASIAAMRRTSARVAADGTAAAVDREVAPLRDVFALTAVPELLAAEAKYLPTDRLPRAIVLATARDGGGAAARVRKLLAAFNASSVAPATIVSGAGAARFEPFEAAVIANDAPLGEAQALKIGLDAVAGKSAGVGIVIVRGELSLPAYALPALLAAPGELVVLRDPREPGDAGFTGVVRASPAGVAWLRAALAVAEADGSLATLGFAALVARVERAGHALSIVPLAIA